MGKKILKQCELFGVIENLVFDFETPKPQEPEVKIKKAKDDYSYLIKASEKCEAGPALGAKNMKKELSKKFPGVKFSVKSEVFSGGSSIVVSWQGRPKQIEVEEIAMKYKKGHFNSSIDLYEFSEDSSFTDTYGGATYVSC